MSWSAIIARLPGDFLERNRVRLHAMNIDTILIRVWRATDCIVAAGGQIKTRREVGGNGDVGYVARQIKYKKAKKKKK